MNECKPLSTGAEMVAGARVPVGLADVCLRRRGRAPARVEVGAESRPPVPVEQVRPDR